MTTLKQTYENDTTGASNERMSWERPPLLTAKSAAKRCNLPIVTLYDMVRQGRIGGVVKLGRLLRFDAERLEDWLAAGGESLPGGWRKEAA